MAVYKLSEHEQKRGIIAIDRDKHPASKEYTDAEFEVIFKQNFSDFKGCDHKFRVAFLKANGYEVNHANMINADLPAVPKE